MASMTRAVNPITLKELKKMGDRAMADAVQAIENLQAIMRECEKVRRRLDESD